MPTKWERKRARIKESLEWHSSPPRPHELYVKLLHERVQEPVLELDELEQTRGPDARGFWKVSAALKRVAERSKDDRVPLRRLHAACRELRLEHCSFHVEPPKYVMTWVWDVPPRYKLDKYGRILHMTKGTKKRERIRADEFAPMPEFEPIFPLHPNPEEATEEEKDQRRSAFLNAYAASGIPTASAQAVGVAYHYLLLWLNETPIWQSRFRLAQDSAKQIMEDIGRTRAIRGDSALMTFFIKHDNPERYGVGVKKRTDGSVLPEGVTAESVADALRVISAASGGRMEAMKRELAESAGGERAGLVDQTEGEKQALSRYAMPEDDDGDYDTQPVPASLPPRNKTDKTIDMSLNMADEVGA